MYFDKIKHKQEVSKPSFMGQLNLMSVTKKFLITNICGNYATDYFNDLLTIYMERANCTVEMIVEWGFETLT